MLVRDIKDAGFVVNPGIAARLETKKFQTRRQNMLRWFLTAVVIVVALLFWYITLTVPMISAAAPAVIAIAFSVAVYFVWPKHRKMPLSRVGPE